MKGLLLLVLIAAVGYLAYDNYQKRGALEQAQAELQQLRQNPVRLNVRAPTAPTPPAWFQERLQDGSTLDTARQHKQKDERAQNATSRP
jgi:cytochrome c-type biogenesis protein CcmH/NrfG